MAEKAPYNPYEHREIEKPISNFEAFLSLMRCVIGTGILAMPLAFYYAGIIGGTIFTILIAALLTYGMHLLISNMTESCKRMETPQVTYPKAMAFAFSQGPNWCKWLSTTSGVLVYIVLGVSHFLICVVYLVFVATNIKQIIDYYTKEVHLFIYITVVGLTLLPFFLVRHLKYLMPFILLANIAIYLGFFCIFWYVFKNLPPISEPKLFQDPVLLPLFLGIVLFSVTSVGVMIMIETQMKKPQDYLGICGVLNKSMVFIIATNILFAIFGYWRYGADLMGSITLNIPQNEILSQCIKFAIALAIFFTYPLSGKVTIEIIVNQLIYATREKKSNLVEYIVRTAFVLLSIGNAIAFPTLGPLLALVGSLTISVLNLIFPTAINMCMLYTIGYGKFKYILVKDIIIFIIGVAILIWGSYKAIEQMIEEYAPAPTESSNTTRIVFYMG